GPALLPALRRRSERPRDPSRHAHAGGVQAGRAVRRRVGPDRLRSRLRHAPAVAFRAARPQDLRPSQPDLAKSPYDARARASSKSFWISAWSWSVSSFTARRDVRPPSLGAGGSR